MAELRPVITAPASALTPEAEFCGALHNHGQGQIVGGGSAHIVKEQAWHKQAAKFFALELSPAEVAAACECSIGMIRTLLSCDWFQARITEFLHEGNKDIIALVNAEAINSLRVMVDLRDDTKVAPTVRLASAKSLLEWKLGKPTQRTEMVATVTSNDPTTEVEMLEKQNAHLRANANLAN